MDDFRLTSQEEFKKMAQACSIILESNIDKILHIEGIVAFGIGMSADNAGDEPVKKYADIRYQTIENPRYIRMFFKMSSKLNNKERANVIRKVMLLPNINEDNVDFSVEETPKGKKLAYQNERIRHER